MKFWNEWHLLHQICIQAVLLGWHQVRALATVVEILGTAPSQTLHVVRDVQVQRGVLDGRPFSRQVKGQLFFFFAFELERTSDRLNSNLCDKEDETGQHCLTSCVLLVSQTWFAALQPIDLMR